MDKSDLIINNVSQLICSALTTDKLIQLGKSSFHFTGTLDEFQESVTGAFNAALHLVDYQDVFEIAAELQRKDMQLRGILPPADDEIESTLNVLDWSRKAGKYRC